MSSLVILAFLVFSVAITNGNNSSQNGCCFHVDNETRQIIDMDGRARIFHGVNIVAKTFPYHPSNSSFDPEYSLNDEDVQFLVDSGFTVVRLYVAWPGVEPEKDNYNITYLNVLSDFVEKLGKFGIYTILDCHQDLFSPKFCGEGVPDYAALYMNSSIKPLPFPMPFPQLTPYEIDPETGYPSRNDCNKYPFLAYYLSDAEGKAWQSLFVNEQELQDRFGLFWSKVSQHFSGNPYVLGYELINEPWAGDIYMHPEQMLPHVADYKNLQPMYSNLFEAINQFDKDHLIFFEPTLLTASFTTTGFTEGPGGHKHISRQVFSYHLYCILMDEEGQPVDKCDITETDMMNKFIYDQKMLGVAGFMTEWGAYTDVTFRSATWNDAIAVTNLADQHLQSWAYWQFKSYGDITTMANDAEGIYYKNGTLQAEKVALLTRTYAQAVSGRYISQSFDITSGLFQLTFQAYTAVKPPSVIYLNERIHYPNGYHVSVFPVGSMSIERKTNTVELTLTALAFNKMVINVRITRNKMWNQ